MFLLPQENEDLKYEVKFSYGKMKLHLFMEKVREWKTFILEFSLN